MLGLWWQVSTVDFYSELLDRYDNQEFSAMVVFFLIQMLVHDPGKFPLVGELGFAISPGTETFVSIKKNEVGVIIDL